MTNSNTNSTESFPTISLTQSTIAEFTSSSSPFATVPGPTHPPPQVPPLDAPYLQKSPYPKNFAFICFGAAILLSFLSVFSTRLACHWYMNRHQRAFEANIGHRKQKGRSDSPDAACEYSRAPTLPSIELDDLSHRQSTTSSRSGTARSLEPVKLDRNGLDLQTSSTGTSTQSSRPSGNSLRSQNVSRAPTPDRRSAVSVDSALRNVSDRLSALAPERPQYARRPHQPPPDAFRRSAMNSVLFYSASTQTRKTRGTGLGTEWRIDERRASGHGYTMRAMAAIAEDEVVRPHSVGPGPSQQPQLP